MKHTSRIIQYIVGWMVASALLALAPATAALGPDAIETVGTEEEPSETDCKEYPLLGVGPVLWEWLALCEASYEGRTCTEVAVVDQPVPASVCEEDHQWDLMHNDQWWHCYTVWVAGEQVPVFGDPDHIALCRTDFSPNQECYMLMVQGEHQGGWFICIIY